ncbi:MAG: hypothetical protein PHE57_02760 [Synergistales bacterium]|nr:hypothetical protein [Synergistales bacterium]
MAKRLLFPLTVLLLLLVSANAVQAQDISGTWDVKVHGFNYFTDREPSRMAISETSTTMEIEQEGERVSITLGAFGGVHAATIFKGVVGNDRFVASWWYEGYPYETKVLTGQYSPDSGRIKGKMIYPRAADKPGLVPGWLEVEFLANRKITLIPKPLEPVLAGAIPLLLPEDCLSLSPSNVQVKNIGGRWKIVDGDHWILDFGNKKPEADKALNIIWSDGLDKACYVGRPDPSMTYWTAGGQAPSGSLSGEDCIGFNPGTIEVKNVDGRWKIVDGSHWVLDFASSREEAETALRIIKHYGFRYICFVGRPDPSMTYFRK